MATAKRAAAAPASSDTVDTSTRTAVNVDQHGFSGETCEIKLYPASSSLEPTEPFFGINFYQVTIKRDKWVRVPVELADHIQSLEYTVREQDPDHPDDADKFIWVERPRFPLQRRD